MFICLKIGYNKTVMHTNGIYNSNTRSNDRSLRTAGITRALSMLGTVSVSLSFNAAAVVISTGRGPAVGVGGCGD
jgi:hypothetical protein